MRSIVERATRSSRNGDVSLQFALLSPELNMELI